MLSLSDYKKRIDADIHYEYEKSIAYANSIDGAYGELVKEMSLFIQRGGKRMRPYLSYLLYEGLAGNNLEAIVKSGTVLEIFHNFLLIHDDIIDHDLVRYGGPNIEGTYFHRLHGQSTQNAQHGALSAALLAGDVANSLAHAIAYDLPIDDAHKLRILRALTDATFVVGGGEFIDSLGSTLNHASLNAEQINAVYLNKTAYYSFYLPFQIAAILTNQDSQIEEYLLELSKPIGCAYQMRDDWLGLFGDTSRTGKPITSDVREGKQTLYYALMQERCTDQQRIELEQLYGNSSASEKDVYRIREICIDSGAAEEVEMQIKTYYTKALSLLENLPLSTEGKKGLQEIFLHCIHRNE